MRQAGGLAAFAATIALALASSAAGSETRLPCSSPGRVVRADSVAVVTEVDERSATKREPGLLGCAHGHKPERLSFVSTMSGAGPLLSLNGRYVAYEVISGDPLGGCTTTIYARGLGLSRSTSTSISNVCESKVVSLLVTAHGVVFYGTRATDGTGEIFRLQTRNAPTRLDSGPGVAPESLAMGSSNVFWISGDAARTVPAK